MKNDCHGTRPHPQKTTRHRNPAFIVGACLGALLLNTAPAQAFLPADAVSQFEIKLHAAYATKDPFCKVGFRRLGGFHTNHILVNLADPDDTNAITATAPNGALGRMDNCILLVIKSEASFTIEPGEYDSTSMFFGRTASDRVCDSGVEFRKVPIGLGETSWPDEDEEPMKDLSKNSLTPFRAGNSYQQPNSQSILPFYFSTASARRNMDDLHPCNVNLSSPPKNTDRDFCNGVPLSEANTILRDKKLTLDFTDKVGGISVSESGDYPPVCSFFGFSAKWQSNK
jgi:hypothetical protein